MKKLVALLVLCLLVTGAYAQTGSGTLVLSGAAGYMKTTQEGDDFNERNETTFRLSPSVGYFIQDELELGVGIGYNYTSYDMLVPNGWGTSTYEVTGNVFSFSPYIRKYFMIGEKVAFTGSALAGISVGSTEMKSESDFEFKTDLSGFQIALVPGVTFFPSEKIGLSATFGSFGYSQATSKPENGGEKTVNSVVGLSLDASTLTFGFSYHFNR